MDLYSIDTKPYKQTFFRTLISTVIITLATYLLLKKHIYLFGKINSFVIVITLLLSTVVLSFIHAGYQVKSLTKLQAIEDFEEKLSQHQRHYAFRLLWWFFACVVGCFLAVATGSYSFLYYGIFNALTILPAYPRLSLFQKELKNEDIVLL